MRLGEEKRIWVVFIVACLLITGIYGLTGCLAQQEDSSPEALEAAKNNNATAATGSGAGNRAVSDKCLRLYMGELSQDIAADCAKTEGDERLLSLMYQCVNELADIRVTKNPSDGHAIYRIALKKQVVDSRGKLVTADALLFNYYWRCQIAYHGQDKVNQMNIDGLSEYQYGSSGEKKRLRQQKVRKLLKAPDGALKKQIQAQIIIPVLEKEYAWVESVYLEPSFRGICKKYPNPVQLFAHYYAINTSYTGKGKSKKQVLKDVAGQYGTDLTKLSQLTGDNYEKAAECIAIGRLWPGLVAGTGKISGIRKLDDMTIEVETTDYNKEDVRRLGQIRIYTEASVNERSSFTRQVGAAGSTNIGGLAASDDRSMTAKDEEDFPVGTGSYLIQEETSEQIILTANSYYERKSLNPIKIVVYRQEQTAGECIRGICSGELDMACVWERVEMEKKEVSRTMETGDAAWKVAAQGGVLFHPGRVNATTVSKKAVRSKDTCSLICGLEMNRQQGQ